MSSMKRDGRRMQAGSPGPSINRREAMALIGAGTAGLAACQKMPEHIVPYVDMPEHMVPGEPLHFATTLALGGYGRGAIVESHSGRPTSVAGNPRHPASLGATDVFMQAAVAGLYDERRSRAAMRAGRPIDWPSVADALAKRGADGGRGLAVLTGCIVSPQLAAFLDELLAALPEARWHQYQPVNRDSVHAAARAAFGRPVNTIYDIGAARRMLAIDARLFDGMPGSIPYARSFASRRRPEREWMNRLYAIESVPGLTGARADHRLPCPRDRVASVTAALARAIGVDVAGGAELPVAWQRWVAAVAEDLAGHRGSALVVPGDEQDILVHRLCHLMNHAIAAPVRHTEAVESRPVGAAASMHELCGAMAAGEIRTLIASGVNPVLDAPADCGFAELLGSVPFTLHHGLHADETAEACEWHVPALHELESWGDARAYDGTVGLRQPLIRPLHEGRPAEALFAALRGTSGASPREALAGYWRERRGMDEQAFDGWWFEALRSGLVPGTAFEGIELRAPSADGLDVPVPHGDAGVCLQFREDPRVGDGRFASLGWLRELPEPITTLTWDNAALVSPGMAGRLGVGDGRVVRIGRGGKTITAPVRVVPEQPDGAITLSLGYGNRLSDGEGSNAYPLRSSAHPWFVPDVGVVVEDGFVPLAAVQQEDRMHGRAPVRSGTLEDYRSDPRFLSGGDGHLPSLYPEPRQAEGGYAWAMSIDLNACIGCGACTIACQAENNIPVVGRDEVLRGREMHWIRIDRYRGGDPLETHFQPVPCMHCENAPCEYVCPVEATLHDSEGLNLQVYNRCIGTRDCSQNCPYKVRRFNWLDYQDADHASHPAQLNPDVTVRSRGVMEKCTYCIQRISRARRNARIEDRRIEDGEVETACQAACPTRAIEFGDLNTAGSKIRKRKENPLDYALLHHLNTRPRTTYLGLVRNLNPALEDGGRGDEEDGHG